MKRLLYIFIALDLIVIICGVIFYVKMDNQGTKKEQEECNCNEKNKTFKYVCTAESEEMEESFKSISKKEIETDEYYSITSMSEYTIYTIADKEAYKNQKESLTETDNYIPNFDDETQTVTLKIKTSDEYIGAWYKEREKYLKEDGYNCELVED